MMQDEALRPKPRDARWTWTKIAIVAATLLAMLLLMMLDLER